MNEKYEVVKFIDEELEVNVIIYTNINSKLIDRDINTFNSQYNGLSIKYTNED